MGCDIHSVFQRKTDKGWETVPSLYEQGRHYQLFGVLANVRNGWGFAGVPTGQAVQPISQPRGLPTDFELTTDREAHPLASVDLMDPRRRKWYEAGEPLEIWMGDHSHSWLSGNEMLNWWATAPKVVKTGVLSKDAYEAWDKTSRPDNYCGGVMGHGIRTINDNAVERATPGWTHISVEWEGNLAEELAYFFDEVKRLVSEYGEIRFVFGFDS